MNMGVYKPAYKPHLGTEVTTHKGENLVKTGFGNNRVLDLRVNFMRLSTASTLDQNPTYIDTLTGVVISISGYREIFSLFFELFPERSPGQIHPLDLVGTDSSRRTSFGQIAV